MTSEINFSKIKYTLIKSDMDVTKTERSSGKLNARSVVNRLLPGLRIDVFVSKTLPTLICDETLTIDEDDIRKDTRRCFEKLTKSFIDAGKLPVHTGFFKEIEDGDIIVVILHEV